ncbi:MAG: hypothetical protein IKS21_07355 [Oscillospiraceae bacterium]|nr:hypothetical protein [Oscillospiraceae bacterium]
MKRLSMILLALCLVLALVACGAGNQTSSTANTPETTSAPETENVGTKEIRGKVEGDAYTNDYLNLCIERPQGWAFYTEDQIAEMNGFTTELYEETDIADIVAEAGQQTDMMMSDGGSNSLNLIIQPSQSALEKLTDEQIFQFSEKTVQDQLNAVGWTIDKYEAVTMQVGGEDRSVLHMAITANGVSFDEYQIWIRPSGDYMATLTLALQKDMDPQPVLDGIKNLH